MKLTIRGLLDCGYFPPELPPPFSTGTFAACMSQAKTSDLPTDFTKTGLDWFDFTPFSLSRPGSLRRRLAILNPIAYFRLVSFVVSKQGQLLSKAGNSNLALLKVQANENGTLQRSESFDIIPGKRAADRVGKHILLTADVSRFYPSIYTHAIDWAVRSKAVAKRSLRTRRGTKPMGAMLDKLVQACQNGQTRGIPIGPAVSMLLGELILNRVDERLTRARVSEGFRAVDDYELVFVERAAAERALATLEDALAEFELELNPHKTNIAQLPQPLDDLGIQELRTFPIREHPTGQHTDFIHLFSRAFELQRRAPDKNILRYAVSRLRKTVVDPGNAHLLQQLILQAVAYEAGVWPMAIRQLHRLHEQFCSMSKTEISATIHSLVRRCARLSHSSEVAWSLWAALVFEISLSRELVNTVARMSDDCSIILLFHAAQLGLTDTKPPTRNIAKVLAHGPLRGRHWLMAYELLQKGWISVAKNYIAADDAFSFLQSQNVEFYDTGLIDSFQISEGDEDEGYAGS